MKSCRNDRIDYRREDDRSPLSQRIGESGPYRLQYSNSRSIVAFSRISLVLLLLPSCFPSSPTFSLYNTPFRYRTLWIYRPSLRHRRCSRSH
ncbi:hypothetical protein AFLA_002630 [Aspergillus flavus NRRL3357]|nr:hypothetical protein AFLA_002630 [Aspergillus flavus NRRL3357]